MPTMGCSGAYRPFDPSKGRRRRTARRQKPLPSSRRSEGRSSCHEGAFRCLPPIDRTPVRAPSANAIVERFVGTVRRECLDRMPTLGGRHPVTVLGEFVDHYDSHHPRPASFTSIAWSRDADGISALDIRHWRMSWLAAISADQAGMLIGSGGGAPAPLLTSSSIFR